MSQTRNCPVGAAAPQHVLYTYAADPDGYVPDLTAVLAAELRATRPDGARVTWAVTVVSITVVQIVVRFTFAADGSDADVSGLCEVELWLTTAAGTVLVHRDVMGVIRGMTGPVNRVELGDDSPAVLTPPAAPVFTVSPTIAGTVAPGQTLTCTPGTCTGNPAPVRAYQWRRTDPATGVVTAIGGAAGLTYVVTDADLGFTLTCLETATNISGAATAASNARAYDYTQVAALTFLIDNASAVDGPLATITDRSPGARALTTGGVAAGGITQPLPAGSPFHLEDRGAPTILFDASRSQWAQDQAGDAASYAAALGSEGVAWIWHGQLPPETGVLFCTRNNTSNNENGVLVSFNGDVLTWQQNSTTFGAHVNCNTPSGNLRPYDTVTLVARLETNRTWSLEVTREARMSTDNGGGPTVYTVTGSYNNPIPTPHVPAVGLTLAARGAHDAQYTSAATYLLLCCAIGPTTTADLAAAKTALLNRTRPATTWDAQSLEAPLVYTGTGAGDTGGLHHFVSGQRKLATQVRIALQQIQAELQYPTPLVWEPNGDSRMVPTDGNFDGTGSGPGGAFVPPPAELMTLGVNDLRTLIDAPGLGFATQADGPLTLSGKYNAVSGFTVRSSGAQLGFSSRAPGVRTDDTNYGPGKAHNTVAIFVELLGINHLLGSHEFDLMWEKHARAEYRIAQILAAGGRSPSFVFINEAVTSATQMGALQRAIRAVNRAIEIMVGVLRAKYPASRFRVVNANDRSYFP